jgi:hypothetical protein
LPALAIERRAIGVEHLPLKLSVHRIVVDVITLKNRTPSALAELFNDCAHKVAKPLTT